VTAADFPSVFTNLPERERSSPVHTATVHGTTAARQVYAVYGVGQDASRSAPIAVLCRDSFWLAHERHLRRSKVFQQALEQLIAMMLRGELQGTEDLSPFGENDGIVYVNSDRRIQYMSGIASALYRQLGYRDSLIGRRLSEIDTTDQELVAQAIIEMHCLERRSEQGGLTWTRKAIPLVSGSEFRLLRLWHRMFHAGSESPHLQGAFILVHDETEALEREAELQSKMAMLREVHHRVKNNLQIIASLMRMQARRAQGEEARRALEESVHRISSVAVVHEFLSHSASQETISLQEVSRRIIGQIRESLLDPMKQITLRVTSSDTIWLPAESATRCALVINELVQNAIEHGMAAKNEGLVDVELEDDGSTITIAVRDNGAGLPDGFDIDTNANLGLQIVRSMVERDLRGRFTLETESGMTLATVRFEKSL
jgi:two-component system, sensor histidine kinase PdtaS